MRGDAEVNMTILVDNRAEDGLAQEHGFSLYVDAGGYRILMDTGQGAALAGNVRRMEIALGDLDALVLSHGHYDHTGAVEMVLSAAGDAVVYCHPGVVWPRYAVRDGESRPIYMAHETMTALDHLPSRRLTWVSTPMQLSAHCGLSGPIPRVTDFEDAGGPFFLDPEGHRPDTLLDDMALWINTAEGTVVCTGCCHAGVVNTLRHIRRLTGGAPIRALVGGFHLVNADARRLRETIAALAAFDPACIVPCHCTGEAAVSALAEAFGDKVQQGAAGQTLVF